MEIAAGLIAVFVYWKFPFYDPTSVYRVDPKEALLFGHAFLFCNLLLLCSVIDLRLMIIPDVLSLGMILSTPLIVWLHPYLDWKSSLLGVLLGGGSLYLITWLYWLLRKKIGMGFGDVKLLAGIGGWLGVQSIFPILLYSSLSGSLIGIAYMMITRQKNLNVAIPFGPFLALGAVIHLFFGSKLILLMNVGGQ